jgi:hypothetical protein
MSLTGAGPLGSNDRTFHAMLGVYERMYEYPMADLYVYVTPLVLQAERRDVMNPSTGKKFTISELTATDGYTCCKLRIDNGSRLAEDLTIYPGHFWAFTCRLVENVGLLVITAHEITDYNLIIWNWFELVFETREKVGIVFTAPPPPEAFVVFTGPADDEASPTTRSIRLETPRTQPPVASLSPVIGDRAHARDIIPIIKKTILKLVAKAGKISSGDVKKQCESLLGTSLELDYSTAISDLYLEDKILVEEETLSLPA